MKSLPLLLTASLSCSFVAPAQDWPRWGGHDPGRNMYSPAKGLPDQLGGGKYKPGTEEVDLATTKNVKWVTKLGSQSYANVVVAGGKIFVGTNNESPRDSRHQGDRSVLYCFSEKTGELLWQLVVPKLKAGKVNDWEQLGLLSSPCVEGNRLYVVTSRCEVLCLDVEGMANGNDGPYKDEARYVVLDTGKPPVEPGPRDADILWRYDMMDELGVFPHNAANCSVIVLNGKVYVCTSNGQDWTHVNVPSPNAPSFIALDANTGALLGEDNAGIGPRIFHGQWSSPSVGLVNGKWQVFFGGGDGVLYAFDPEPKKGDGLKIIPVLPAPEASSASAGGREEDKELNYLKKLWWFDCTLPERRKYKYPAAEGPSEVNSTPVFYKNRVYAAVGQDPEHGEGVGRLVCVDPTKTGDITKTGLIWDYQGIHRSISTVSIDPGTGLLFVADFSGFIHCLDAETGKPYWTHDMKAHMWGSTLVADGKVYCGDEDGDVVVLAATKEKKVLSETNLNAPVFGTPIVANGRIYIQSNNHLYSFYDASKRVGSDEVPKVELKK